MNYKIIRSLTSLLDLESRVNEEVKAGYKPEGAPFFDGPRSQWCQAVFKPYMPPLEMLPRAEVQIREPKAGRR